MNKNTKAAKQAIRKHKFHLKTSKVHFARANKLDEQISTLEARIRNLKVARDVARDAQEYNYRKAEEYLAISRDKGFE